MSPHRLTMLDVGKRRLLDTVIWTASMLFVALLGVHEANAGESGLERTGRGHAVAQASARPAGQPGGAADAARYVAECGSCHVAYPPGLLSAGQWQRVLAQLDRHYGVDASVEPAQRGALDSWLTRQAGARSDPGSSPTGAPRITTTRWFVREHREVPLRTWSLQQVGSASRCEACHAGAEQGNFDEHGVRLPR